MEHAGFDIFHALCVLCVCVFVQGLVEVVTGSDGQISVRATVLLGELLHMVRQCLCMQLQLTCSAQVYILFVMSRVPQFEITMTLPI